MWYCIGGIAVLVFLTPFIRFFTCVGCAELVPDLHPGLLCPVSSRLVSSQTEPTLVLFVPPRQALAQRQELEYALGVFIHEMLLDDLNHLA